MFKFPRCSAILKQIKTLAENIPVNCFEEYSTKGSCHSLLFNEFGIKKSKSNLQSFQTFHTYSSLYCEKNKYALSFEDFNKTEQKNKKAFLDAIQLYKQNFPNRKGHLEFIESAKKQMKNYGVQDDLDAYKKLLEILPQGPFIPKNIFEVKMVKFPQQQFLAEDLIMQMADYGVIPDVELGELLKKIFGRNSLPHRKFGSLMYWSMKFKNKSPWKLPKKMPNDALLIAKFAIDQITSVDVQTEISVFQTDDVADSIDKTWIVSGQSPKQKELLEKHPFTSPVVVEAGDPLWIRDKLINYFILKADIEPSNYIPPKSKENLLETDTMFFNPYYMEEDDRPSVHEQDDGIIYSICATGTSSKDSLLSWIRLLQKNGNPVLGDIPVLFRFREPEKQLVVEAKKHENTDTEQKAKDVS